jgi:eukaryotic-like serine/threonine-protein kinase
MQRLVALKISADKGNESQTLATLDHPHIVRVYDQRRLEEKKLKLMYMQYAPGGTLQEVVQRVRRTLPVDRSGKLLVETVDLSLDRAGYGSPEPSGHRHRLTMASWPETVCRVGIQLAQALDYAHRHGVLHRDVKPANVLLTAECTPKLADFNISFSSQLDGASPSAYFGGSLAYMSPEQLEACNAQHERTPESLDGRADMFSLAAMLWELLYGERPFREEGLTESWTGTLNELTRRRREEAPKPPASAPRDDITLAVSEVLLRALSANMEERPSDGAALARELALCLQPRSRNLLQVPRGGIRQVIQSWPLLAAVAVILVPNALAGAFNYWYNGEVVIRPQDLNIFRGVSVLLNVVYFSVGAVLIFKIVGPDAVKVSQKNLSRDEILAARLRLPRIGHLSAGLGILLWLTSGIAFPLLIGLFGGEVDRDHYFHFFASMMVCGLVAAAYPFFGATYLVTHAYYPALLSRAAGSEADEARLLGLARSSAPYLLVAGGVPLLGTLLMVVSGSDQRLFLVLLILAGILGLVGAYLIYQRIRDDIAALVIAVRPVESASTMTETVGGL